MARINNKVVMGLGIVVIIVAGTVLALVLSGHKEKIPAPVTHPSGIPAVSSPNALIKAIPSYLNKEVQVPGVIEVDSNKAYFLVSTQKNRPAAIQLDFSQTKLQPNAYLGYGTRPHEYTITGKVTAISTPQPATVLIVHSIK